MSISDPIRLTNNDLHNARICASGCDYCAYERHEWAECSDHCAYCDDDYRALKRILEEPCDD